MGSVKPGKVIQDLIEIQQKIGDFVANGPSTGLAGHVRDRYRDRCNQFANVPGWVLALSPIGRQSINNWCSPYWADSGFDGPVLGDPPFTGGQCAVAYWVDGRRPNNMTFQSATPNQLNGPISGAVVSNVGPGPSGTTTWRVVFQGANGTATLELSHFDGAPGIIPRVRRVDNQPDNCGDPPIDPTPIPGPTPPPNPGPLPGPEPTDDPRGGPFPDFPIPPWPGPLADYPVVAPPDEDALDPDDIPPTGGDGLPGDPTAIGPEAGEVAAGGDGEDLDFGEPPVGKIWVGCIVETTTDSQVGNIPGTGPGNTVWPTVRGNLSLIYGSKKGSSIRINSRFTEAYRPITSVIVTGAFLQMQPFSSAKVFPISASKCPENPCGDN